MLKMNLFRIGLKVIILLIYALCIMLLWNALLPMLIGLPTINFIEALGIRVLIHFLIYNINNIFSYNDI